MDRNTALDVVLAYPWDLVVATNRGWDSEAHINAIISGNEDDIGLTHPTNFLTEEEVERYENIAFREQ